jgi:hypothetical protein
MRNYSLFLIVPLMALICSFGVSAAEKPKDEVANLLSHFPGYHLMTLSERDPDTKAYILRHFPKDNPSLVHADFDGDGYPDYALLLKHNKSQTAKLVVLLCPENDVCRKVYETVDMTGSSAEVYIRPLPVGSHVSQTDAIDTRDRPSPIKLRCTGLEVTYFEKAAIVYYWNKRHMKIEAVQTGD